MYRAKSTLSLMCCSVSDCPMLFLAWAVLLTSSSSTDSFLMPVVSPVYSLEKITETSYYKYIPHVNLACVLTLAHLQVLRI